MYYTGIDLHKKTSFITSVDEQGHVQARRNLPNQLPVILEYFSALAQPTKVVIESMGSWYWLYDALREAGHEVIMRPLHNYFRCMPAFSFPWLKLTKYSLQNTK